MHNYEHKKLVEAMTRLNQVPEDPDAFSQWIQAQTHLAFLRENAHADELIICSGSQCFVNSVVVPNDRLQPIDKDDLMNWNFNQFTSIAGYVSRGGGNDVRVELDWNENP